MPNIHSNIRSSNFYGILMSELLCIAGSSTFVISFYEKTNALITLMEKQSGNWGKLIKQIWKTYENYQLVFQKYDISNRDIVKIFQE